MNTLPINQAAIRETFSAGLLLPEGNLSDLSSEVMGYPIYGATNAKAVEKMNGASHSFESRPPQTLLSRPMIPLFTEYFVAVQKWEGYVLDVSEDTFVARLIPLKGEGGDQEAEIYLNEVDDADKSLIIPGAVFYWSIGYRTRPSGSKSRESMIRFRRLPSWTKRELAQAEQLADKWTKLFDAE